MKVKTIPLSVTLGYVQDWGFWEMFREFTQNALDEPESKVIFNKDKGTITISNAGRIPESALLYGNGTKKEDELTRGKHAEGLKNALLVSIREEVKLTISNAGSIWSPVYKHCDVYGSDTLHIEVLELCDNPAIGVSIVIEDVSAEDMEICIERFLSPNNPPEIVFGTVEEGYAFEPLTAGEPQMFVGGLFVGPMPKSWYESQVYRYSYNFPPSLINLDRDRNSIDEYKIQGLIADILIKNNEIEMLIELGYDNALDVEGYSEYKGSSWGSSGGETISESLAKRALGLFYEKNGTNAYPICKNRDSDIAIALVSAGGMKPVLVPRKIYSVYNTKEIINYGLHTPKRFDSHEFLAGLLEHKTYSLRGKAREEIQAQLDYLIAYYPK